jgi:ATP-dependent DNA ligase
VAPHASTTSLPAAALTNSRGAVSPEVRFSPELLTRVEDEREAERFVNDPRYIFQNKEDADRLTVQVLDGNIFGYNKTGQVVRLDAQLHAAISKLCELTQIKRLLIDGEWPTPTGYIAWDVLECWTAGAFQDLRAYPYRDRLNLLELLFGALIPAGAYSELAAILHITETARTPQAKRAMLTRRYDGDTKVREGVCIKDLDAPYRPGRNGQHKKFKFEQTASFLVGPKPGAKARDGHRSIALYIVDPAAKEHATWLTSATEYPNRVRFVSTAKVADKYELPPVGSIVEARYVAAYRITGGIEQPTYFGKMRSDVRPEECSTAQLKYKACPEQAQRVEGAVRP